MLSEELKVVFFKTYLLSGELMKPINMKNLKVEVKRHSEL